MTTRPAKTSPSLELIFGLIVFSTMTIIVWQISENIRGREPLTIVDARLSSWLHTHQTPGMTTTMFAITSLGSTQLVSAIAVGFGMYFVFRRRCYWLAALLSSVFGGMVLNKLLKYVFHRARPFFDDPLVTLTSYSFPSGHTMMATTLYALLAAYFLSVTKDWRWRACIVCTAAFVIVLVGFSRIYLGAHYLSDVLGAMAEGMAWLSLCLMALHSVSRGD